MGQELLSGSYIQADETTVGVQMHDGRGKNHQAYLWEYSHPAGPVVFDFRLGREREGPKRFLGNFEGLLQSDGYGAYDHIGGPRLVHAACWAHARRKFFDAVKLHPKDTTSIQIVAQMDELFGIEAQARQEGLSQSDRHVLRLDKSKPLLEEIKTSIQAARTGTLPKSAIEGLRLHEALESAQQLPRISGVGIEQQLGRKRDAPGRSWPTELDTRRKQRGWTTGCRHHFDRRNLSPPEPTAPRLPRLCASGLSRFSEQSSR